MPNHTTNYQMLKPTYAELADIQVINDNFEMTDDIMHKSQISLADAYDQTATYNTGDVVMYEMLMYKCKADNVTGNWDATKWERTTASECGASTKLIGVASGNPASFPDGSDNPLEACNVDINPAQDLHGYDKPWAGGAGKNKCPNPTDGNYNGVDVSTTNGVVTFDGTATQNTSIDYFRNASGFPNGIEVGNQYTISIDTNNVVNVQIIRSTDNSTFSEVIVSVGKGYSSNIATFTLPNNTTGILIRSFIAQNNLLDGTAKVMIESGSTATTFEPYSNICPISPRTAVNITVSATQGGSGEDTQISLGRNVYGGTLNVKTGELTVEKGYITFNGSENWQIMTSAGYPYAFRLDGSWGAKSVRVGTKNAISNIWDYSLTSFTDHGFRFADNNGDILYIYERLYEGDLNGFKAFLNTNNMQMVYNIATPLTYTLTGEEVRSILGQNYIEADSGEITVAYVRDLNSCISNIISRLEALEQANSNRSLSLNRGLAKSVEEPQEEPSEEVEEELKEEVKEEPEVKEEENNERYFETNTA